MMVLFGRQKKKGCCSNNWSCEAMEKAKKAQTAGSLVKVLGSGCAKCRMLKANTEAALEQLGLDTTVEYITDFKQIASYGVMTTPALVVNGKVVSYGKVATTEDVMKILKDVID